MRPAERRSQQPSFWGGLCECPLYAFIVSSRVDSLSRESCPCLSLWSCAAVAALFVRGSEGEPTVTTWLTVTESFTTAPGTASSRRYAAWWTPESASTRLMHLAACLCTNAARTDTLNV